MYSVDWDLFIQRILPWFKRKPIIIAWLRALIKPLKQLNSQFLAYVDDVLYRLAITSQIIYLEKLLNDKFNNGLPARDASATVGLYDGTPTGIYITDPSDLIFPLYIWNKVELRPAIILYNKWRDGKYYGLGDFVVYGDSVWKCIGVTINTIPPDTPSEWEWYSYKTYLRNKSEFDGLYEFIINVPIALGDVNTDAVLVAQIKAWVKVYLIAGKRFNIVNY